MTALVSSLCCCGPTGCELICSHIASIFCAGEIFMNGCPSPQPVLVPFGAQVFFNRNLAGAYPCVWDNAPAIGVQSWFEQGIDWSPEFSDYGPLCDLGMGCSGPALCQVKNNSLRVWMQSFIPKAGERITSFRFGPAIGNLQLDEFGCPITQEIGGLANCRASFCSNLTPLTGGSPCNAGKAHAQIVVVYA